MKKQNNLIFLFSFIELLSIGSILFAISFYIISLNQNSIYADFLKNDNSSFTYVQKKKSGVYDIQELDDQDIDALKSQHQLKISKCYSVYPKDKLGLSVKNLSLDIPDIRTLPYYYIKATNQFDYSEIVEVESLNDLPYEDFIGMFPKESGQVIITSLLADYIIKFSKDIRSYDEIISKKTFISLNDVKKLQITGIIKIPLDEFEVLKNEQPSSKSIVGDGSYHSSRDKNLSKLYQKFLDRTYKFQNLFSIRDTIKSIENDSNFNIIISSVYLNYPTKEITDSFLNLNPIAADGMFISKNSSDGILSQISTLKNLSKLGLKISFFIFAITLIGLIIILKANLSLKSIIKLFLTTFIVTFIELYFSVTFICRHFTFVSPNYSLPIHITFTQILAMSIYIFLVFSLTIKKFSIVNKITNIFGFHVLQ